MPLNVRQCFKRGVRIQAMAVLIQTLPTQAHTTLRAKCPRLHPSRPHTPSWRAPLRTFFARKPWREPLNAFALSPTREREWFVRFPRRINVQLQTVHTSRTSLATKQAA